MRENKNDQISRQFETSVETVHKLGTLERNLWNFLPWKSPTTPKDIFAMDTVLQTNNVMFKGIVSGKFDMLLVVPLDRYKNCYAFFTFFTPFLKISSLSRRIIY
jgi:hypothetical protein